jgi:hypothetical protein
VASRRHKEKVIFETCTSILQILIFFPCSKYLLEKAKPDDQVPSTIRLIGDNLSTLLGPISSSANLDLTPFVLEKALGQSITAPNRLMSTRDSYAALAMGFPDLSGSDNDVYVWPRTQSSYTPPSAVRRSSGNNETDSSIFLPKSGQVY